jgi:hypothetical protein
MFTTRLRITALLVLTILLLAAGGILIPRGAQSEAAPAPVAQTVPKELLERRLEVVNMVWEMNRRRFLGGKVALPNDLLGWSERMLEAELPLLDTQKDRITALQKHMDRTREVEQIFFRMADVGVGRIVDAHAATYERLNAEIRFFEATGEVPPPPRILLEKQRKQQPGEPPPLAKSAKKRNPS